MPRYTESQAQFSPREAGVQVLKVHKNEMYIWDNFTKSVELWVHNQDFPGTVLRYKNKNYAFVKSVMRSIR